MISTGHPTCAVLTNADACPEGAPLSRAAHQQINVVRENPGGPSRDKMGAPHDSVEGHPGSVELVEQLAQQP
jgi:hypothetical protein